MAKTESPKAAITPTRNDDYAEWYQQVVRAADLAENWWLRCAIHAAAQSPAMS